jgi:hypothetical protein
LSNTDLGAKQQIKLKAYMNHKLIGRREEAMDINNLIFIICLIIRNFREKKKKKVFPQILIFINAITIQMEQTRIQDGS